MLPQFVAIAFGQQKNTKRRDYADKANHCVIISADGNIAGFGAIKIVSVWFLSTRGLLFIRYYDTKQGIKSSLKIFIKVASTVKIN